MIEKLGIKTLDDVSVEEKCVLVRVDFNSPVDPSTKKILDYSRIKIHAEKTISELVKRKARTVILAHQGRRGEPDFISLKQHAEILSNLLGIPVKFVDDIFGEKAQNAIRSLKPGEVLVLENVRMWEGETKKASAEEHAKTPLVKNLAPLVDVFVIDAFAAAHRPHVSMIGFAPVVEHVVAGRVMEAELRALVRVRENPEHPCVYVLGGAKAEDSADIVETVLGRGIADCVLTGGLVANLFIMAKGYDIGEPNKKILEKKGFLQLIDRLKEILAKYGEKVKIPIDLAIEVNGERREISLDELPTEYLIKDIGSRAAAEYREVLLSARTVVMNGPMGVFEEEAFSHGTREVFKALSESKAFSLIGGGHTIASAHKLGFADKVSFLSTGGGALIEYLVKGTLPVVEVLKKYSR